MDKRKQARELLQSFFEDIDCFNTDCRLCGFGIADYDNFNECYEYRCALQIVISALR